MATHNNNNIKAFTLFVLQILITATVLVAWNNFFPVKFWTLLVYINQFILGMWSFIAVGFVYDLIGVIIRNGKKSVSKKS